MRHVGFAFVLLGLFTLRVAPAAETPATPAVLRAGIIGLDTSHVIAFTQILNNPKAAGDLAGIHVVAAYQGGSPDIDASRNRLEKFTADIKAMNVEVVDSIPALVAKVDVVLLESVDGRPHLEQVRPVLAAHKPVFIDKPLAGSLADAIAIDELAKKYHTPWFSSSALRFDPIVLAATHDPKIGDIVGCAAWGPSAIEKTHPDLFWYGIHACEMLYTVMGPGCESVTRTHTEGTDVVTGVWKDGRIGTFRGLRAGKADFGMVVYGSKKVQPVLNPEGYKPLVEQIAKFFKTHEPPVANDTTIELYAFMEAADESKREGGAPVKLQTVMAKAREAAEEKIKSLTPVEGQRR